MTGIGAIVDAVARKQMKERKRDVTTQDRDDVLSPSSAAVSSLDGSSAAANVDIGAFIDDVAGDAPDGIDCQRYSASLVSGEAEPLPLRFHLQTHSALETLA